MHHGPDQTEHHNSCRSRLGMIFSLPLAATATHPSAEIGRPARFWCDVTCNASPTLHLIISEKSPPICRLPKHTSGVSTRVLADTPAATAAARSAAFPAVDPRANCQIKTQFLDVIMFWLVSRGRGTDFGPATEAAENKRKTVPTTPDRRRTGRGRCRAYVWYGVTYLLQFQSFRCSQ